MGTDLWGHGHISLRFGDWEACCEVARLFGWRPEPHLDRGSPESCDYGISDPDARSLALALYRAIRELESGREPTPDFRRCLRKVDGLSQIRKLADFAILSGFDVD